MARGQKYNDDIKEKAFAMRATNNSFSSIARELGVPRSTIMTWFANRSDAEEEQQEELRQQNKDKFVTEAWETIHAGIAILSRRFKRASESEQEMDRLLAEFSNCADELNENQIKALLKRFQELQIVDVGKIAVVLGTLYDKQALIAKEATARVEMVEEMKFEDFNDD